jgi:hypothetical protein
LQNAIFCYVTEKNKKLSKNLNNFDIFTIFLTQKQCEVSESTLGGM